VVFISLIRNGVDFDILAGSSIGAINTSIIGSAQDKGRNDVSTDIEEFWLSLSENMGLPNPFLQPPFPFVPSDEMMAVWSSIYSILYGSPKAFLPRWLRPDSRDYFVSYKRSFLW
jgi:NTE family protein